MSKLADFASENEIQSLALDGIDFDAEIGGVIKTTGATYLCVDDSGYANCIIRLHPDAPPVVEPMDSLSDATREDCAAWL